MKDLISDREAADIYQLWADGRCPCCGSDDFDNDDAAPAAIGEGVTICAYCTYRGHDRNDVAPHLLQALATRKAVLLDS